MDGNEMRYMMRVIGEPDENGLYPLYDRLIEDMILFKNADPNRVYLLGFSAGGL